jgi:hypothetical protein
MLFEKGGEEEGGVGIQWRGEFLQSILYASMELTPCSPLILLMYAYSKLK